MRQNGLWGTMARYLIVGVANTVVGLAVILLLQSVAGLSSYAANAGGYICGILLGFALNRGWTFRSDGSYGSTAPRYVLVFGVCYALNLATLLVATHWLHWPAALAQAVSLSVYSITFFCLCRNVVFGSPEESISKLRRKRDQ